MNRYINQLTLLTDKLFSKYKKQINSKEKVGVLVSGGIDSSIVASFCHKHFSNVTLLSFGTEQSKDKPFVQILQKHLDIPLIWLSINDNLVNANLKTVKKILEPINLSNSLMHLSLATGYFLICQASKMAGISNVFTGQGPDVIMAGYSKYKRLMIQENGKYDLIKQEIIKDLDNLKIDKVRDNTMANYHKIQLYNLYLEQFFIDLCLEIPVNYKLHISNNVLIEKYIERLWGKNLDLPDEIVWRAKMAFQYSPQVQKLVQKAV